MNGAAKRQVTFQFARQTLCNPRNNSDDCYIDRLPDNQQHTTYEEDEEEGGSSRISNAAVGHLSSVMEYCISD